MAAVNNGKNTQFKEGNSGRPKGAKNKFTNLKHAFLNVFEKLGGENALYEWAKKTERNKSIFYGWITRMLPTNVDVAGDLSVTVKKIITDKRPEE